MQKRESRPRAAKTAAIKKIAAICELEAKEYPECENDFIIYRNLGHFSNSVSAPIKTHQFPFIREDSETHEEAIERLNAQLKYYREHPFVLKKSRIARFFSYLKKAFK